MSYQLYKRISVTSGAAIAVDDVSQFPHETTEVEIQVDGGNVRATFDGTNPTTSRGYRLLQNRIPRKFIVDSVKQMRVIAESGTCGLNLSFWGPRPMDASEDILSDSSASTSSSILAASLWQFEDGTQFEWEDGTNAEFE